ncbi:MAG: WapI family immunity protein [Rhabdaerophilum sp.]
MHVTAQTAENFFSLKVLKTIAPPSENDLEWLICEVEWRQGKRSFRATSECLTSDEARDLRRWIQNLEANPHDSVLAFTEPSLHCISLLASDVVVFVCWLELTPSLKDRLPVALAFPRQSIRFIS